MSIHKKTKLTAYHRQEIWRLYHKEKITVTDLAKRFINFYNTVKPHKVIFGKTPYDFLEDYFNHEV